MAHPFWFEGAGKNKLLGAMDFGVLDEVLTFTDEDAIGTAWHMARDEGLSTFFNPSWLEEKGLSHIMPQQDAV